MINMSLSNYGVADAITDYMRFYVPNALYIFLLLRYYM
jgi:hypothetical protein